MRVLCKELGEEVGATPAQVALNWVQSNNSVTSTIIGAKRLSQLEDNLGALDFTLSAEQRSRLEALCPYAKHFPHNFLDKIAPAIQNGSTVNGVVGDTWGLGPTNDSERH